MQYVLYFISIILITMFLVLVGYFKEKSLPIELTNRLYRKCKKIVIENIKQNNKLTMNDIKKSIKGTTASVFWSRKKVQVTDTTLFSQRIIEKLIEEKIVMVVEEAKNKKFYALNEQIK